MIVSPLRAPTVAWPLTSVLGRGSVVVDPMRYFGTETGTGNQTLVIPVATVIQVNQILNLAVEGNCRVLCY